MDIERLIKVCKDIKDDMRDDATNFDGKPFTGKTVAEYFGNQGAAIAALAGMIITILQSYLTLDPNARPR